MADFNRDGKPDLAVPSGNTSEVSVLLGKGDGSFVARTDYAAPKDPITSVAADFNGDGKLDLAVATFCGADAYPTCPSGGVDILFGNGDATFNSPVSYLTAPYASAIATGDFNKDGKADLVTANYIAVTTPFNGFTSLTISILIGNGDGTFQAHMDYLGGSRNDNSGYLDQTSVAVADLNGDGKSDIVVAAPGIGIVVWLGNGDGTFRNPVTYAAGGGYSGLAVGDLNGDGKLDLVVCNGSGTTTYDRYGNGHAQYSGTTISVLLGNGDGTFRAAVPYTVGNYPASLVMADFDGDGVKDIGVINIADKTVSILAGKGDGTFTVQNTFALTSDGAPFSLIAGDFNLDGVPDLMFKDSFADSVILLLGNGDGSFQSQTSYDAGFAYNSGGGAPILAVGDFNNDREPDVAVANNASDNITILRNIHGPDFVVKGPSTNPISPGELASVQIPIVSVAGFTGSVALTCSVSPTPTNAPTCSLNPDSVQLSPNGSANSTLTVNTTAGSASLSKPNIRDVRARQLVGWLSLSGTMIGIAFVSNSRKKAVVSSGLFLVLSLVLLEGCGGGSNNGGGGGAGMPGTPAGNYTITITAKSGTTTHNAAVSLVVQ